VDIAPTADTAQASRPRTMGNIFAEKEKKNGGRSGIRTHDTVTRIHAFQACAFNHSATRPRRRIMTK
jgi:hypothetical protein